jgi:hypothetical protein
MLPFRFCEQPWENSRVPSITREHPEGNDDRVLAQLSRVNHPDDLYELCRLANSAEDLLAQLQEAEAALKCWIKGTAQLDSIRKSIAQATGTPS